MSRVKGSCRKQKRQNVGFVFCTFPEAMDVRGRWDGRWPFFCRVILVPDGGRIRSIRTSATEGSARNPRWCFFVVLFFMVPDGGRIRSIRTSATEGSASLLPAFFGVFGAGWGKDTQYPNERDRREREFIACVLWCILCRMGEGYAVSERARPKGARVHGLRCLVY